MAEPPPRVAEPPTRVAEPPPRVSAWSVSAPPAGAVPFPADWLSPDAHARAEDAAVSFDDESERTFVADPARLRAALEDDARLARAEAASRAGDATPVAPPARPSIGVTPVAPPASAPVAPSSSDASTSTPSVASPRAPRPALPRPVPLPAARPRAEAPVAPSTSTRPLASHAELPDFTEDPPADPDAAPKPPVSTGESPAPPVVRGAASDALASFLAPPDAPPVPPSASSEGSETQWAPHEASTAAPAAPHIDPSERPGAPRLVAPPPASLPDSSEASTPVPLDVPLDAPPVRVAESPAAQPPHAPPTTEASVSPPLALEQTVDAAAKRGRGGPRLAIVAGVLLVLGGAGGLGGWRYLAVRRGTAAALVATARGEAIDGDGASLADAERHLREAVALDAADPEGARIASFVATQRALEDGAPDAAALRVAITDARRAGAASAWLDAADAVLATIEGRVDDARRLRDAALRAQPRDAATLYVAGRIGQQLGEPDAAARLAEAVSAADAPAAARLALAEARLDQGDSAAAVRLVDEVLALRATHLRALLWRGLLGAGDTEPATALTALSGLDARVAQAAQADRVLAALAAARQRLRAGDLETAGASIDRALGVGVRDPRWLARIATEARACGRLEGAQQAAREAVAGAPMNADYRRGLAEVQLALHDGAGALATLAPLPAGDLRGALLSARAALLVGADAALASTRVALDALVTAHPENVEARALRLRVAVRLGDVGRLEDARKLAREAPSDPLVALAVGEAALAAREPETAARALEVLVAASPSDPDAHYLLGRARRMGALAGPAAESLHRALALAPQHAAAAITLGGLLLDTGAYDEAERLYADLAAQTGVSGGVPAGTFGRLGRIEALIGLGRSVDARAQLAALPPDERALPSAQLAAARLALAEGAAPDAVAALRPLAESPGTRSSEVLALFGDALFEASDVDAAAQQFDAALALDAGSPEALLGRARVALRAERPVDVRLYVDRLKAALLTRLRPPSLRARLLLVEARVALLTRDAVTAQPLLREATALAGAPAEAHFFLGEASVGVDAAVTRAAYERYVQLAPAGEFAARARRALER